VRIARLQFTDQRVPTPRRRVHPHRQSTALVSATRAEAGAIAAPSAPSQAAADAALRVTLISVSGVSVCTGEGRAVYH
jgi:hypothetical protein